MELNEIKKYLYKSKNIAKFSHYQSGKLFYNIELIDGIYQFPISTVEDTEIKVELKVQIKIDYYTTEEVTETVNVKTIKLSEDLGDTSFGADEKGASLIRWISKAIDNDTLKKIG